jgi:DNA-binding NtrC family response regulator
VIVTQSAKLRKLIRLAERVGASSAPVLLTGESGTGKELFAQLIHAASSRREGNLVCVNCAALSRTLIESELFGHEKGSFTDAASTRKGRFELASEGTLLLDEVGEIPVATQAKLLRVLESNEFERVGSSEPIRHNTRLIAASNRNLAREIRRGRFRLDLFHRISVVQIHIPPLRDRREDLPALAMHFLERFKSENPIPLVGFTRGAMEALAAYPWPGNVRELRNVIHRACILTDQALIDENCLQLMADVTEPKRGRLQLPEEWLATELADIERQVIVAAIKKYGNQRVVAEKLGVSPRTLTNKIRRYREQERLPSADAA